MYSVVLAAVLSSGSPLPAHGGGHSNHGGSYYSEPQGFCGCVGYSGQGCMGCQGCNGGCRGGFLGLGITDFFTDLFSFRGGNGCSGCCGGCQGCFGGCHGCYGSMMPGFDMPMGGMPMGMPMGTTMPMPMQIGGDVIGAPGTTMPTMPMWSNPPPMLNPTQPGTMPGTMPQQQIPVGPEPKYQDTSTPPDRATVIVTLPADARLFVGKDPMALELMALTGAVRTFRTPALQPGKKANYTIKMEVERAGKKQDETKEVELQPGKTTQVFFGDPGGNSGSAQINVKIPEGATLMVEGQTIPAGQQSIQTPTLEKGKEYTYTLKLERDRNGQKETLTRDVSFRAGEVVAVNFDARPYLAAMGR